MPTTTAKRSYRRRISASVCRGRSPISCRHTKGCKYIKQVSSKNKKVSTYCRKRKSMKR